MANQPNHPRQWPKGLLWAAFALVALLIVINIVQGLTVQQLSFFGLFSVSFDDSRDTSPPASGDLDELDAAERQVRQAELEARIQELNARLDEAEQNRSTGSDVVQVEQSIGGNRGQQSVEVDLGGRFVDVNGSWLTNDGIEYVFAQTGNFVTIEEYSPLLGLGAAGSGTINGNIIEISFQSVLGGFGTGTLQVSPDGSQISGTFVDGATGFSVPVTMFR